MDTSPNNPSSKRPQTPSQSHNSLCHPRSIIPQHQLPCSQFYRRLLVECAVRKDNRLNYLKNRDFRDGIHQLRLCIVIVLNKYPSQIKKNSTIQTSYQPRARPLINPPSPSHLTPTPLSPPSHRKHSHSPKNASPLLLSLQTPSPSKPTHKNVSSQRSPLPRRPRHSARNRHHDSLHRGLHPKYGRLLSSVERCVRWPHTQDVSEELTRE